MQSEPCRRNSNGAREEGGGCRRCNGAESQPDACEQEQAAHHNADRELMFLSTSAAAAPVPKSRKITRPPQSGFGEFVAWAAIEGGSAPGRTRRARW
jgi:hypothetical protein